MRDIGEAINYLIKVFLVFARLGDRVLPTRRVESPFRVSANRALPVYHQDSESEAGN